MANSILNKNIIDNADFPGKLGAKLEFQENEALWEYRSTAWRTAQQLSFPAKKDEAWRWVNFEGLDFANLQLPKKPSKNQLYPGNHSQSGSESIKGYSATLSITTTRVNQQIEPDLDQSGIVFLDFKTAEETHPQLLEKLVGSVVKPSESKFAAMTSALAEDGALLYIPKQCQLKKPFLVRLFAAEGDYLATFTHILIWLEAGASAEVELEYGSELVSQTHQAFHAGIVEIHLESNAKLKLTEIQGLSANFWNITHERAQVENDAHLEWLYGAMGSRVSKNFINADLVGVGADAQVNGFYLSNDHQQFDLDTQQNHLAPKTTSNLLYKGAVTEASHAVWEGMIYVAPVAMQADGYQSSRNLVLSDQAKVNAIPGLEILADDVRCSHGATVGKIDEEQLFYLQTRGIPAEEAEELILEGFFGEVLEKSPNEAIQEDLKEKIYAKFANVKNSSKKKEVE